METLLHFLLQHDVLSPTQYWHLRLLSTLTLGPLLSVLYLVYLGWRKPRTPRAAVNSSATMWVSSDGQLLSRRARS
ncbi:hypothetical protein E4631_18245 [Hymenobacter sp. UV11]|uniref:hypothetical protein n=1 Tax=Hymenobacter sp. UV11 TaxID=1849735 RepID=UPI00105BBAB0|nr:hypothetical protein [Hymenobacter sp. UV11]TFZ64925.1 hypothetical protein E4631_18245 [Hymenobacter sp. UV11]